MAEGAAAQVVSVIIPTRNRAGYLCRAIDSVRRQTLAALEIIVVDDASDDDTPVALATLAGPDLHVIRTERRQGASHARNLGIAAARGSLLGFLDDDDRWLPEKLAVQVPALAAASASVGLVCCAYHVVSASSGRVARTWRPPTQPMDLRYFLRTTGFMTTVPLLRRACLDAVGGFDAALEGGQDLDLWIRVAERFIVMAVPDVLAEHHIHGRQITSDLPAKARAAAAILRKHREQLSAHPDLLRRHLERTGLLLCAAGNAEAGRLCLAEALELAPHRDELRTHIERSHQDATGHAGELIASVFPTVDGIRLFY